MNCGKRLFEVDAFRREVQSVASLATLAIGGDSEAIAQCFIGQALTDSVFDLGFDFEERLLKVRVNVVLFHPGHEFFQKTKAAGQLKLFNAEFVICEETKHGVQIRNLNIVQSHETVAIWAARL